jgi:hypothetical protein
MMIFDWIFDWIKKKPHRSKFRSMSELRPTTFIFHPIVEIMRQRQLFNQEDIALENHR